jgi:hypothetical protein
MIERRRSSRERRRSLRAPLVAAVRERVGGEVRLALAQNLGERGIALRRVAGTCRLATPMALAFELPDGGGLVNVRGAVVFERADGGYLSTGVRFEDLTPLDHARIVSYLRRNQDLR